MLEAEIQVFAIALEVSFGRPRPYSKEKIDDLPTWLTDAAEGFALRPEQVRVRHTDSEAVREAYLAAFRPSDQVVGPGALGFVRLEGWPEDIRIAIEPSLGLPSSLFFAWHTRFLPSRDPIQLLQTLVATLGEVVKVYGVTFKQHA
jgi:hypothetical protein